SREAQRVLARRSARQPGERRQGANASPETGRYGSHRATNGARPLTRRGFLVSPDLGCPARALPHGGSAMYDSHALATLGFRPTTLFNGFPYLVTRVVPVMYHIIVLPDDLNVVDLIEIARRQARATALETCLVLASDSALYIAADGRESRGEPPRGGVIVTGRLRACRTFPETESLIARRAALGRFIEQVTPR